MIRAIRRPFPARRGCLEYGGNALLGDQRSLVRCGAFLTESVTGDIVVVDGNEYEYTCK